MKKQSKRKYIVIAIIILLIICLGSIYILYSKGFIFKNKVDDNDSNNIFIDNNKENIEIVNNNYDIVKILDYSEDKENMNGTSIIETDKYYILETSVDYQPKINLYNKSGKDVTKEVFGYDNISFIDGLSYNKGIKNKDVFVVRTSDNKHGLYDSNFKEIVKIGNQVIERTNNDNYFLVGDSINNPSITDWLENVGVYDKGGKLIIPRKYERLYFLGMYNGNSNYDSDKGLFYGRIDGKYGIIDDENNTVIPFEYDRVSSKTTLGLGEIINNKYYILYKNGKYGMVDENNKTIIEFDKNKLFYNKYANSVIEQVSDSKLNVYDLNGELKKEIKIDDKFKVSYNAYYYKFGMVNLLFYDNNYVYILNKNIEYEKYTLANSVGYGRDTLFYLIGNSIYLKENNNKYKIYNKSDDTLYDNNEYYLIDTEYIKDIKGYILCKDKDNNDKYSNCGIIGYDGNKILDFTYTASYSYLGNNKEIIEFIYSYDNNKYMIKRHKINDKCNINNNEFFINDGVIKVGNAIYNNKCTKIADDITNYYVLNNYLVMTEKFTNNNHNDYKIYDINTSEIANISNMDNLTITNDIRTNLLNNEPLIMTDNGVYKIIVK